MPLVDDHGRIFGRFNLLDLAAAVVLLGLIPLGYGAYALFRVPLPVLTGIDPATQQLDREMRLTIHGANLRPYMRISLGNNQTRAFLFKDTTTAEVVFSDIPPGQYDVVLYDFAQERSRLPNGLTIAPPALPITEVFAAGYLTGVTEQVRSTIKVGFSFQGLAEIVAIGAPGPDLARVAAGDRLVDIPGGPTVKVPMLLRIPCTVEANRAGTASCRANSSNGPGVFLGPALGPGIYLPLPIFDLRLPFLISQVRPSNTPTSIEVRVRVAPSEDAGPMAKVGDTDVGVAENPFAAGAVVTSALSANQLTFHVPAFATMKGWDYSGQLLRVGGGFNFVSTRYQLSGTITMVPPVPPPAPAP